MASNMFVLFFFLFGLIIGSFLNVVIYRYNTGMGLGGRSQCFSCTRTLTWYDLIPVFSFLVYRGRCRVCHNSIAWQYPAVEVLTGIIFAALYVYNGLSFLLAIDLTIWSSLVVICVYDIRHKIIPDLFVGLFIIFAYIRLFLLMPVAIFSPIDILLAVFAGPILFLPFFLLWYYSKGMWMGLGDGKLAIGIGALLGISYGFGAVILSFWIGAAVSLIYMGITQIVLFFARKRRLSIRRNKLTIKSEIPFAPFLIIGLWIVFYWHINVFALAPILAL